MHRTFSPDDSFHLPALENDDVFFVVITKQYRLSITVVFYLTDCAFGESGSMAAITPVRRPKDLSRHLVPGGFNERFLENRALTIRGLPRRFQNVIRDPGIRTRDAVKNVIEWDLRTGAVTVVRRIR